MDHFPHDVLTFIHSHIANTAFDLEGRSLREQFDPMTLRRCIGLAVQEFSAELVQHGNNSIHMSLVDSIAWQVQLPCVAQGQRLTKRRVHDTQRSCFEGILIMEYSLIISELYPTLDAFLRAYPEFRLRDQIEQGNLWRFSSYLITALKLLNNGSGHKGHLLDLCSKLSENFSVRYVTGGGQRQATKDRVAIFRKESQVPPVQRRRRAPPAETIRRSERETLLTLDREFSDWSLVGVLPSEATAVFPLDDGLNLSYTEDLEDQAGVQSGGVGEVFIDSSPWPAEMQVLSETLGSLSQLSQL